MLSAPLARMFMARAAWPRLRTACALTVYTKVLPCTMAVYRVQAAGTGLPRASRAIAGGGASKTSEMPLPPTRKVETVAGTEAKDGELKPVTVVCAHSAGLTV